MQGRGEYVILHSEVRNMNFDISIVVWGLLGAYAIFTGIKRGKQKNAANIYKYTRESVDKFSKCYCVCLVIIGLLLLLGALFKLLRLSIIFSLINTVLVFMTGIAFYIK